MIQPQRRQRRNIQPQEGARSTKGIINNNRASRFSICAFCAFWWLILLLSLCSLWLISLRHHQLPLPQIFYSIAQLRGFFKFKFLCVLAHFKIETRDRFFNLLWTVAFDVLQLQRDFEIISLSRRHQSRFDWLDDRHWRNPVFAIIDFL